MKSPGRKNKKSPTFFCQAYYMDGLVSTGNQIPYAILKYFFANKKIFFIYFINIFFLLVDKEAF